MGAPAVQSTVAKMGSPEELQLLADLAAQINQLTQLAQAQQPAGDQPPPAAAAAADTPPPPESDEERRRREAQMAAAAKAETSDSATGRDSADERVADLPEQDEENLQEIKRSLAGLQQQLSVLTGDNGVLKTIVTVGARLGQVEKAFDLVLEQTGVADQLRAAAAQAAAAGGGHPPVAQPAAVPPGVPTTVAKAGAPVQAGAADQFEQVAKDLQLTIAQLQGRVSNGAAEQTDLPRPGPASDPLFKSAMVDFFAHPNTGIAEAGARAQALIADRS